MNYKSELLTIVRRRTAALQAGIEQINEAKASGRYTLAGLQAYVDDLNAANAVAVAADQARALQVIDQAAEDWKSTRKSTSAGNLQDAGYQAGLANVLQLIRSGAMDPENFPAVLEAYEGDTLSMAAVTDAVRNSHNVDLMELLPQKVNQGEVFAQLRKNARKYIAPVNLDNNAAAQMGLSLLMKILDRMNDNLIMEE